MEDKKWTVVRMPDTDVRLIIPGDVELFCMASMNGGKDIECCKHSDDPVEYKFPLMAIIDGLEKLNERGKKVVASYIITEIAKAADIGIVKMQAPADIADELAKSLKGNGGDEDE